MNQFKSLASCVLACSLCGVLLGGAAKAAENPDDLVQRLRQQSAENSKIRTEVTNLEGELAELQQLMTYSGVMDEAAMKRFMKIYASIQSAGNQSLVNTAQALLASIQSAQNRKQTLGQAVDGYSQAAKQMESALQMARENANQQASLQKITQIIQDQKSIREDTFSAGKSELEGRAVSAASRNGLSSKQFVVSERIVQFGKEVQANGKGVTDKDAVVTELTRLSGDGHSVAAEIDAGNLLNSVKKQEALITALETLKKKLLPEGQKSGNNAAEKLESLKDLQKLVEEIGEQAKKISDKQDNFEGKKEDLLKDEEYNKLQGDQNDLVSKAEDIAKKMEEEAGKSPATDSVKKAIDDLKDATSDLSKTDTKSAIDNNQQAQNNLKQAADQQLAAAQAAQDQSQTADSSAAQQQTPDAAQAAQQAADAAQAAADAAQAKADAAANAAQQAAQAAAEAQAQAQAAQTASDAAAQTADQSAQSQGQADAQKADAAAQAAAAQAAAAAAQAGAEPQAAQAGKPEGAQSGEQSAQQAAAAAAAQSAQAAAAQAQASAQAAAAAAAAAAQQAAAAQATAQAAAAAAAAAMAAASPAGPTPPMPTPDSQIPGKSEGLNLKDNQFATNGKPESDVLWRGAISEQNQRSMMQGMNEKAPVEYEEMVQSYFQSLSTAVNN